MSLLSGCELSGDGSPGTSKDNFALEEQEHGSGKGDHPADDGKKPSPEMEKNNSSGKGSGGHDDSPGPAPPTNGVSVVLAMGDSITAGEPGLNYPELLAGMIRVPVINEGVQGERSHEGLARSPGVLARYRPDAVLILYGVNDLAWGVEPARVLINLEGLVNASLSAGAYPVLATLTPVSASRAWLGDSVRLLNREIRGLASREQIALADLERTMTPSDLQADGLHPNAGGLEIMAAVFSATLSGIIDRPHISGIR